MTSSRSEINYSHESHHIRKINSISRIYAVSSKLLNLGEVFLRGILFYILSVSGSDMYRRRYVKDCVFIKVSVEEVKNLIVMEK
ncbi:hypothetical protein RCL_jg13895.t1 [Rhizophagus clarus]|uniref:Uncharacterized protein n=1 Tax=Rhizophagus clarus TaxID=94130 RepID=A0A8H3LT42_9GLOM|nr:hypothetical protein RCL_jg13895.t1 [Rhizophagus clarus]